MTNWPMSLPRGLDMLGRTGLAGIAALVLAAAAWLGWARPLAARRAELAQTVARAAHPGAVARNARAEDAHDPAAASRRFYAAFPPLASNVRWLAAVQQAAIESGVTLDAGTYRLERPADLGLVRYRMMFPVGGSYKQVRAFIAALLAAVPAASLDDVQLVREQPGSPRLEARLSLSLYLREAP